MNPTPPQSERGKLVDDMLVKLHDLGFHGRDLAHLETLADFIIARIRLGRIAAIDEYLAHCNILRVEPSRESLTAFQAGQQKAFAELTDGHTRPGRDRPQNN